MVLMKREDDRSRAVEQLFKTRQALRRHKAVLARISTTAIFKCSHEMSGKTFLVSIYEQKPRGYVSEGIRVAAYDPVTSATFTLALSLREFDAQGYGRTREGLSAFCKWLCLLYEKRRRRFRLVWSGAPCPPPLRTRDYDRSLICAHKEGLKMSGHGGYALVAMYVRSDDVGTIRFVMNSLKTGELVEVATSSKNLFTGDDFVFPVDPIYGKHSYFVDWKHHDGLEKGTKMSSGFFTGHSPANQRRVYSGPISMDGKQVTAHVYDVDSSAYAVDVVLNDSYPDASSGHQRSAVLLKRTVNPYGVPLPTSSFGDLLACIKFERATTADENGSDKSVAWQATVSAKWFEKLGKYVRVLRLAKFARKMAGSFCFVTLYLVQQKTEFRAHLLLELTWIASDSSTSKQSLRIGVSDYLCCSTITRRLGLVDHENLDECAVCLSRVLDVFREQSAKHHHDGDSFILPSCCPGCLAAQAARIGALQDLVLLLFDSLSPPEALDLVTQIVFSEHCNACGAKLQPLVMMLSQEVSRIDSGLLSLLERYFRWFDYCQMVGESLHDEARARVEDFRDAVSHDRVVVVITADFGCTTSGANAFMLEFQSLVYPDTSDLPFLTVYVVKTTEDLSQSAAVVRPSAERDHSVIEAISALRQSCGDIRASEPVELGDDPGRGDAGMGFDAYLVAEALLIEAVRVVLEPQKQWKRPTDTVGASSWTAACEFMRSPQQLSDALQRTDVLRHSPSTRDVLTAYFSHPQWAHDYGEVRAVFHNVLAFMMHVERVYHRVAERGGSLMSAPTQQSEHHASDAGYSSLCPQTHILFL